MLHTALPSTAGLVGADLLVQGVDEGLGQPLKHWAGAHGRSAEAERRAILAARLADTPRQKLAELQTGGES